MVCNGQYIRVSVNAWCLPKKHRHEQESHNMLSQYIWNLSDEDMWYIYIWNCIQLKLIKDVQGNVNLSFFPRS